MRVLVSAASKHGATAEISRAIADALARGGHTPDVVAPERVKSLVGYDAFVLGSGVYAGRWLEPMKQLINGNAAHLAGHPVWLFSSGPIGNPAKPDGDPADVAPIVAQIRPRGHRVFAGRIDKSQLGFAEKAILAVIKAPEGDFRPWHEIDAWAAEIAASLEGSAN